jgi:cation diffusion facilitator family transporter
VAVNLALAASHAVVAAATRSHAVAAELTHNHVDLLSPVAVLVGLKLATRKTTAFPYGLYKLENLVAVGLAGMVFFTGWEIARATLLEPPSRLQVDAWMLGVLVWTAALPLVFAHFELRAGRAANSPALIADASEYRVHVATTGLAASALISEWLGVRLDRAATLIILIAIGRTGWELMRDAARALLDASLDARTLLTIRAVVDAEPAVAEIKWVTGRNAGRFRFVEAGVVLRVATLDKAEAVVRRLEASVRAAVPHVERVLVHIETSDSPRIRYAVPLADRDGTISEHFGESPLFALVTVRRVDGRIEEQRIAGNPHRREERAKGIRVAEWLVDQKVDVVLLRDDMRGKGPGYVLRDAGVAVRRTDARTLAAALTPP